MGSKRVASFAQPSSLFVSTDRCSLMIGFLGTKSKQVIVMRCSEMRRFQGAVDVSSMEMSNNVFESVRHQKISGRKCNDFVVMQSSVFCREAARFQKRPRMRKGGGEVTVPFYERTELPPRPTCRPAGGGWTMEGGGWLSVVGR